MNDPLEGRIRRIAREEAAAACVASTAAAAAVDVRQQLSDLHEHLHHAATTIKRLESRVEALEKAPEAKVGPVVQEPRAAARRAVRKDEGG